MFYLWLICISWHCSLPFQFWLRIHPAHSWCLFRWFCRSVCSKNKNDAEVSYSCLEFRDGWVSEKTKYFGLCTFCILYIFCILRAEYKVVCSQEPLQEAKICERMSNLGVWGPIFSEWTFKQLGPGRPLAGGPRMDRRAVTSSKVVNTSRLASLHKREVPNKLESESETCMAVKLNFRLPIITFP